MSWRSTLDQPILTFFLGLLVRTSGTTEAEVELTEEEARELRDGEG